MSPPARHRSIVVRPWKPCFILALFVAALIGCERGKAVSSGKTPTGPPPSVVVTDVVQRTVPIYFEFVARTDAVETVEIRARVQAYLQAQHFQEGTVVKKGQLLFTLDPQQYVAQLRQAQGQLAKAKADLAYAQEKATVETAKANLEVAIAKLAKADQDVARLKPLADRKAVPSRDYDDAVVAHQGARADVSSRKASLETAIVNQRAAIQQAEGMVEQAQGAVEVARLNLDYCTIRSPLTGLIGERKVAPGNLVGRGDATLLDTVSSLDPIRAYLAVSETEYLAFMAMRKNTKGKIGQDLELILADGSVFPHRGRLVIADRAVDEKTGTLSLVAEFPNPDGLIRPGQFGRVRLAGRTVENALLVPQRAVTELQDAKAVYVVGSDGKVAMRTVQVTDRFENFFIVTGGVKAGERVVVEGVLKVRPGIVVQPTTAPAPGQQPTDLKKS